MNHACEQVRPFLHADHISVIHSADLHIARLRTKHPVLGQESTAQHLAVKLGLEM